MIYVIRHGQTDWNLEGRYQGSIDIELNNTGRKQALEIKEKLKDISFDKVFSSPLKRAYETASIIYSGKIIIDSRITERCNGELEGKDKKFYQGCINFADPKDTRFGVEPLPEFRKRILDFFDDITRDYKNMNILVVTHAGVSIYAKCYFDGEPKDGDYSKLITKNCEVLQFIN